MYANGTHPAENELILQVLFDLVQPYTTILVPTGAVYAHSRDLLLAVDHVAIQAYGTGPQPELLSTDVPAPQHYCMEGHSGPCMVLTLRGDGDSVSGILIANAHTPTRTARPPASGLWTNGDNQTVTNTAFWTSDENGVLVEGAHNVTLDHLSFFGTGAASLNVRGSGGDVGSVSVQDPVIVDPGDDGICLTSAPGETRPHDIWINGANYTNNGTATAGHGLSVVGADNVYFTNFTVDSSPSAGIYVASGTVWGDGGSSGVHFGNGLIMNANSWAGSGVQNGAVRIYPASNVAGTNIDDVDIENLWILNTSANAYYDVGDFPEPTMNPVPPPATNVMLKNITITGGPTNLFVYGNTPPSDFQTIGWNVTNPNGTATALADHPSAAPPSQAP